MILIPPSKVIQQYLLDMGVGVVPGTGDWQMFISHLPDQPNNAACVYDLDVVADGRVSNGERIEHPACQIRVRGKDYSTAWSKGIEVRDALDAIRNTVVVVVADNFLVHNFMRTSSLIPLGVDPDTRLVNFTLNGEMTVSLSTP